MRSIRLLPRSSIWAGLRSPQTVNAGSLANNSCEVRFRENRLAPMVNQTVVTLAQKSAGTGIPAGTSVCRGGDVVPSTRHLQVAVRFSTVTEGSAAQLRWGNDSTRRKHLRGKEVRHGGFTNHI